MAPLPTRAFHWIVRKQSHLTSAYRQSVCLAKTEVA